MISHRSVKNRGERPQSRYINEHEGIVSQDDFDAVQLIISNSKYRNKSLLPVLQVIPEGLLKGFVIINPRWSGFKEMDYLQASASAYPEQEAIISSPKTVEVDEGDFDLRGFEVVHLDFFDVKKTPSMTLENGCIKFNAECLRRVNNGNYVELLVHPTEHKLAVRQTVKENRNAVLWAMDKGGHKMPHNIACKAFIDTLFSLFGWNIEYRYRLYGSLYRNEHENAYIFNTSDAGVYIREQDLEGDMAYSGSLSNTINRSGKHIGAIPAELSQSFGNDYYVEKSFAELIHLTKEEWQIRIDGQLCNTGKKLNVTPYEDLKAFIQEELGDLFWEDEVK